MLTESNTEVTYSTYNSSHSRTDFSKNWGYIKDGDIHAPDIYETFRFIDNTCPGVLFSHRYPRYDHIAINLPDVKVIIITFTNDDLPEIAANTLYKNHIAAVEAQISGIDMTPMSYQYFLKHYQKAFGKPYTGSLSKDDIHGLWLYLTAKLQRQLRESSSDYFATPIVPASMQYQVLALPYSELYTPNQEHYVGLTKIAAFANRVPTQSIIDNYRIYVNNRTKFLKEKLTWL